MLAQNGIDLPVTKALSRVHDGRTIVDRNRLRDDRTLAVAALAVPFVSLAQCLVELAATGLIGSDMTVYPLMAYQQTNELADTADLFRTPVPGQRQLHIHDGLLWQSVFACHDSTCMASGMRFLGLIHPVMTVTLHLPVDCGAMNFTYSSDRCRRISLRKESRYLVPFPLGQLLITHGDTYFDFGELKRTTLGSWPPLAVQP
jgi:hypothetical protein